MDDMVEQAEKVLVVSPNWLGDVVMAWPGFQAWRRSEAGGKAEVWVLARRGLDDLWRLHEGVAGTIRAPGAKASRGELAACVSQVREGRFDRAVVLPNSWRSAWMPFRAGIPRRVGTVGHFPRRFLLTELRSAAQPAADAPLASHQAWEAYGVWLPGRALPGSLDMPEIQADGEAVVRVKAWLAECPGGQAALEAPRRVALVPGAARGDSKQWAPGRFAKTAALLHERVGATAILLGTKAEAPLCEQVAAAVRQQGGVAASLAGLTNLPEMAAALSVCDGVVCNDSGGMHLAAALGRPTVAVFGITDPAKTGPLGPWTRVLQESAVRSRKVPRHSAEATAALARISPEMAAAAMESLWAAQTERG